MSQKKRDKNGRFLKGHKTWTGKKLSEEHKNKIRSAHKGKKHSKEHTDKMANGIKDAHRIKKWGFEKGFIPWNKGKKGLQKHTEEWKMVMSEKNSGKKHWNWQGGISKSPYPFEFDAELKLKIRERDNFNCCLCGKTEREELEDFNRVLSVNHIDFDKNNCNPQNLNTLCLKCNVKINKERDYWTNYFNIL